MKQITLPAKKLKARDVLIGSQGGRSEILEITPYNALTHTAVIHTEHGTLYPESEQALLVETRRRKF